jgi:hypothetical protein
MGLYWKNVRSVELDGIQLGLEPGQTMIPHGPDSSIDMDEAIGNQP